MMAVIGLKHSLSWRILLQSPFQKFKLKLSLGVAGYDLEFHD
jgi:hypothetical protein